MAGFLVRQLGFSGDPEDYVRPARQENPHCSLEQSETITVRWTWDGKKAVAQRGGGDFLSSVRNRCATPEEFIAPTALQIAYIYNEFPQTTWTIQISDLWSGQPISESYKALPRPVKQTHDAHFTGLITLLIPPGYQGEPADIDRVHYRALLPGPVIEQFAGPILQEESPELRELRGKIRYTRFENTHILCTPLVPPSTNGCATGDWAPTIMVTFVLKYCLVNGMV